MNRNKVYLLAGIVMIALSAGGWLLYGLQGSLSVSHAQSQTCTGQPSGYFFEEWTANEMSLVDASGNLTSVNRVLNGAWPFGTQSTFYREVRSTTPPNDSVAVAAAASLAPTKWQVTGRVCP